MFQQYSSSLAEYQRLLTFEPLLDDVPAHFRQQLIAQVQHLVSVNPSQLNDRDATDTFIAQVPVAPNVAQECGRVGRWWRGNSVVPASGCNRISDHFLVLVCYFQAGSYRCWYLSLLG